MVSVGSHLTPKMAMNTTSKQCGSQLFVSMTLNQVR